DHGAVQHHAPMQVWPGDPTRGADRADSLTSSDVRTWLHGDGAEVADHAEQASAVIEPDGVTVEEVIARVDHLCGQWRAHRRACWCGDVHPAVGVARLAIENPAQAKGTGAPPCDRGLHAQVESLGGRFAEGGSDR